MALMRHVRDAFESYVKLNRKIPQETMISIMNLEDPGRLADSIAAHLAIKVSEKQHIAGESQPCRAAKISFQNTSQRIGNPRVGIQTQRGSPQADGAIPKGILSA